MKKIIVILLLVMFFSCKKNTFCWHCTFGASSNGQVRPPEDICNDTGQEPGPFKDADGNELSYICTEK